MLITLKLQEIDGALIPCPKCIEDSDNLYVRHNVHYTCPTCKDRGLVKLTYDPLDEDE